jgi:hypothetical protein
MIGCRFVVTVPGVNVSLLKPPHENALWTGLLRGKLLVLTGCISVWKVLEPNSAVRQHQPGTGRMGERCMRCAGVTKLRRGQQGVGSRTQQLGKRPHGLQPAGCDHHRSCPSLILMFFLRLILDVTATSS